MTDFDRFWDKALRHTEIIRPRIQPLSISGPTALPYIFLAESSVNLGDTVVRRGEIMVEKPAIILPEHLPQFEGFESPQTGEPFNPDIVTQFLMVRGIRFPSMKYNNRTYLVDVREGKLQSAIDHYAKQLQRQENLTTGLVIGPEDCWQFSMLIFICGLIQRTAESDIQKLLDEYRRKEL
ncbi:hypothetical protein N9K06_01450 [Omnitrophica bacterium]|nr:hypothetical protein [Candidatus Omnitrophota bacterium]